MFLLVLASVWPCLSPGVRLSAGVSRSLDATTGGSGRRVVYFSHRATTGSSIWRSGTAHPAAGAGYVRPGVRT